MTVSLIPDLLPAIGFAAAAVFVASSVIWMVLPHPKKDWAKAPDEPALLAALRGVKPGQYCFPAPADPKDMASPEFVARCREGPVGTMIVRPSGPPGMNRALVAWLGYCVAVSAAVAYVASRALHRTDPSDAKVLLISGSVAMLAYAAAIVPGAIWWGRPWTAVVKDVVDGAVYGGLTGLAFMLTWPDGG